MAAREGFFETISSPTLDLTPTSGELLSMAVGDTTIGGDSTNFDPQLTAGELITFVDDDGARQFYTIKTINSDILLTLNQPIRSVFTTGGANFKYYASVIQSPSFVVRDAQNLTYPLGDPIFGFGAGGFRLTAPRNSGVNPRDSINNNEGITIKSVYARNPYQHTWADKGMQLIFRQIVEGGTGTETIIDELGINGELSIPGENVDVPVNIYVPPFQTAIDEGNTWGITVNVQNAKSTQDDVPTITTDSLLARMSNVSVPSEMDGLILPVVIGIRFTYGMDIFAN